MNKTKDWSSVVEPRVLLIGENSTLQWTAEVIEYVMFLDYYFRPKPFDLGERSRYAEAKNVFDMVTYLTNGTCRAQELYGANLSNELLEQAPKGKRILLPEDQAKQGVARMTQILQQNPSIEYVMAMGMQVNRYLQMFDFFERDPEFLAGAEPRTLGLENSPPYYQPVNGKVFRKICARRYRNPALGVDVIPILPAKDYPLREDNLRIYEAAYCDLRESFTR